MQRQGEVQGILSYYYRIYIHLCMVFSFGFVMRSVKAHLNFLYSWCSERKNFANLQILHAVRDRLSKLMNSHPEFSSCADTTAAFILQTCK